MAETNLTNPLNQAKEEWRPVVGYEGLYEVSNMGRVRSTRRRTCSFVGKIIKQAVTDGYFYVHLSDASTRRCKNYRVQRLVAAAFLDNFSDDAVVNHIDGCKTNNRVNNLECVTHTENMRHAVVTGLTPTGEKHYSHTKPEKVLRGDKHWTRQHPELLARGDRSGARKHPEKYRGQLKPQAKLNDEAVREIRRLLKMGLTQTEIGARFGVRHSIISDIKCGKRWTHVE